MIKCICIDTDNQPEEIPSALWPKLGELYHITHIHYHNLQGVQGCDLYELKLTPDCFPFETYKLSRFAFTQEGLEQLAIMMKACTELNDIDVKTLIEEMDLETIEK